MSSGSRVHAYFLLMARLAAIWSILPPPGVCSSPPSLLAGGEEHHANPRSSSTKLRHELHSDNSSSGDFIFGEILREKRASAGGGRASEADGETDRVQSPNLTFADLPAPPAANETHVDSASDALDNDTTYDYFLNDTVLDLDQQDDSGQNSTDGSISNIKVYEFQIIKVTAARQ